MGHPAGQQPGVVLADVCGLDLEHRQVIDAARAAALATVESLRVQHLQVTRGARDICVESDDRVDRRNVCIERGLGQEGTVRRNRRSSSNDRYSDASEASDSAREICRSWFLSTAFITRVTVIGDARSPVHRATAAETSASVTTPSWFESMASKPPR